MSFIIEVADKVKPIKRGKGTVLDLAYTCDKSEGEVWHITNFTNKLDDDTIKTLKNAKAGDSLQIMYEKNGKYANLIWANADLKASPPESVRTTLNPPAATGAKPSGYDNLGQQIGNSITNAVNSLGTGKSTKEYKERAIEFIMMGDDIRALVASGETEKMSKAMPDDTTTDDEAW